MLTFTCFDIIDPSRSRILFFLELCSYCLFKSAQFQTIQLRIEYSMKLISLKIFDKCDSYAKLSQRSCPLK